MASMSMDWVTNALSRTDATETASGANCYDERAEWADYATQVLRQWMDENEF